MPPQAEMRLNARIFFSPLAPPHSRLRRLVETCGVLGCVAAPASSDVFASVRSVLGDVVTRCSSILGASSTIFKLFKYWVQVGIPCHYFSIFSTECFACCFLAISCLFYMYAVLSTQYPCACGFGMDMRPNSESDLWRQRGVSRVARGCRTRLRGDSTGWPGQVALASCMHWPSAVYGVCVRRFPIVDCRFEFRASKLINSKSNSIFEPRN